MKFGVFYEHQTAKPWGPDHEHQLFKQSLDQIALADRLGFDYVWLVEHHFLEEYSHSSAPEVFLAAASQRTSRIRLGHGIVNLMPSVNHPARVAERIATLDLISDGRVEFGSGESSSQIELGGFGVDRARKREFWKESLGEITRMFVESPYAGHVGNAFSMPPREVLPKPLQKPHPPLWVACSRRETIVTAAENGIGALSFAFIEPEQAQEWVDEYYKVIESDRCRPIGFDVNANVAVVLPMMCHRDEDEAVRRALDGANFFGYSLAHYYVFGRHRPGVTNVAAEFERRRGEFGFGDVGNATSGGVEPLGVKLMREGMGSLRGAIGTPEQIVGLVERYRQAGVDQVIFVSQCGAVAHEHVLESYELFASEVMPEFAADDPEIAASAQAKAARLAPSIEAALARREPPRTLERDYVVTPTGEPDVTPEGVGAGVASGHLAGRPGGRVGAGRGARGREGRDIAAVTRDARKLVARRVEQAQRAIVGRMSDGQLERTVGSRLGMRLLIAGMERMYRPDKAGGFRGKIEFTLTTPHGPEIWTLECGEGRGKFSRGPAEDAKLRVRARLADFLRVGTGAMDPGPALVSGRLGVRGDFEAATKLGEMFGGKSFF